MVSTFASLPGYRISEEIYNGSRTLVYRGYRETDSLPVVIKLLKNPYPSLGELVQFRNQYSIAKHLTSPKIIQTYSLEAYQNGYALVMEDFGGISLKDYFAGEQTRYIESLKEFLEIAIALCNTLDILYHERIIHKDIKPSNILINPETKQVKLIDFSIASLLPRETQTLINPNVLEGTLAYISPEQTGRMNRGIDYRTDFYSVGVTFYELLTGILPFQSHDPMELVHCHIAKPAPLVNEINPQIPYILSEIVMKLMAKNVEDRYQSALGLKLDLENCLHQLQVSGRIESFEIGQRDVCDRFIIPDKLYGRETEVSTLLKAFERVSLGATEMMLVAGFSGIGKTAIVNEVHKPIVRQRGYFIKGKYDQFGRNIPFSAFVQAFRDLMGQLLSENDAQIQQWKSKILSAVGENGQVIIEVIPELEIIIGQQPSAPELSGTAAESRFNFLFQTFTQVFTSAEHPLVIFLDDLQWADSASLKLMQLLMSQSAGGYLLLIGAYRDNEVFTAHPLMLSLEEIKKSQVNISKIKLAPLSVTSLNQLVAETLNCCRENAQPLTELIYQKTKGNPFFITQFFKSLYEDKLIIFNTTESYWQCDMTAVKALAITDDLLEFMALQLQKLPQKTQNVLKLAACIGNQFDLATLAIVSIQSEVETASDLWRALQEGLILPQSEAYKFYVRQEAYELEKASRIVPYKFMHDRVQQAAYFLIPEEDKQVTHLQIGQLLLEKTPITQQEDKIFEIVNQLNVGMSLIVNQTERNKLAQLNLIAGKKAMAATAYVAALRYLNLGIELLGTDSWDNQYDLTLALYIKATETAYLSTQFEKIEIFAQQVMKYAKTLLDKVKVYEVKILSSAAQNKLQESANMGLEILHLLGVNFPDKPMLADIQQGLAETSANLQEINIENLITLPEMIIPEKLAAMEILTSVAPVIFKTLPALYPLIVFTQVNLSIKYGNAPLSPFAYVGYGLILCGVVQDIDSGYKFGELAKELLFKLNVKKLKAKICSINSGYINHWKEHIKFTLAMLQSGYQSGLETGDLEFAAYCAFFQGCHSCYMGKELTETERNLALYSNAIHKLRQENPFGWNEMYRQLVLNLLGKSPNVCYLKGEAYNEELSLPIITKANDRLGIHIFYASKLILCYLFEEYFLALENAQNAAEYLDGVIGMFAVPLFHFYDSLARLAFVMEFRTSDERDVLLNQVKANQEKMKNWANYAPMNFLHKYYLVEAEFHRLLGQKTEAIEFYDRSISLAKENEYIQEEALANELAAKFYLEWGKEKVAQAYMQEAYYCYARWGALAKVADLERRYPQLLAPILEQTHSPLTTNETIFTLGTVTSTSISSVSAALDLATILKASQTISGEIELEKLLSVLLHIVIENAGADKCVFMLLESDRLLIQALARLSQSAVDFYPMLLNPQPVEDSVDVPVGLINSVKRSLQPTVIINATVHPQLSNDPYIEQQQPKSILCSPILHQRKLLGVLYLENKLAAGAFTSDRVELLNLLCAQAAISLQNARLYQRTLKYAQQLEESFTELSTSNSRFEKLVDNVPGVVYQYRISVDGVISLRYISADCYELYEITAEEAIANVQLLTEAIHPDDAASHQQSIIDSMQTLIPWEWSGRIVTASGILKWIYGSARVELQTDGTLVWDGVLLDISERKIAELALQQKSLELEAALQNLQQAQLQIVQSEKMSALGNLVAGVAHEMNNPLGFITASVKQAKPIFADIVNHLKLYQEKFPTPGDEILIHAKEIDLEYSLEDLPKMIDSMNMACDRLKNISTSLRTFSRADRDYKVRFNIYEGIDSTILILKHRLKANNSRPAIEIVTDYGNLPQIECFPGQLNQVFMNILANAIDALDESNIGRSFEEIKANPNRITITTSLKEKQVKVKIADNGQGMSESVKQKVFDHLFTTKGVGKGTGLGLAIAQSIVVEKHGGTLDVNSTLGVGTEFVITLPILAKTQN
ncbi:trifunctional serine/threonine-protein kinase/ATP-binding protein/sensor histidine kinase [Nostoc sp. NMS4]|uniref:trifunctional serine/threonine-protein kinase/ATP-binding protein/sensor histidine kinase n=1 Tax=Nostoc sp. NMS4 TaxID=2815390 RepID=UPI0025FF32F2|nr:trifunctional serine/threonine-protein kinase/ATP-binding protein/sensor histidine kinase [Nostoc sp. NMS4]MBN3922433.1 AAA family ATPase [Nostoc sp. NMS4]